jgi:ribosomal protein S12 methylthiotransferase accessory factor
MLQAADWRHGVVAPAEQVPPSAAEPAGFWNFGVPQRGTRDWRSASGGAGWTEREARLAAIGEALERYAAAMPLEVCGEAALQADALPHQRLEDYSLYSPEQRGDPLFPERLTYGSERRYVSARSLSDGSQVWVPVELVALERDAAHALATSNGLAFGLSREQALVCGLQELVERDALMVAWLHALPGREQPLPERLRVRLGRLGSHAEPRVIDLSVAYCPWPVAAVAGLASIRGRPRYSLGSACAATWQAAVDKAFVEWLQGVAFVTHHLRERPGLTFNGPQDVRTFDDHAVYYSVRPRDWSRVPLLRTSVLPATAPRESATNLPSWDEQIDHGRAWVRAGGLRVQYVELRPADLRQLGLWAVKVLSCELVPIYCDQRWPPLGGTWADVSWRFPDLAHCSRPVNPLPHPLG